MSRKSEILDEMENLANEFVDIVEMESRGTEDSREVNGNLVLLMTDGTYALKRIYASALDIALYMKNSESVNETLTEAIRAKNIIDLTSPEIFEED